VQTPTVVLEHPGFQPTAAPTGPISAYDAAHKAPPRPEQPKTGLWIEIPSLQIALPVQSGDGSDRIPYWVALRYPGTAAPGERGNSYLYAHGIWGMFGGLLFARQGQPVMLRDYSSGAVKELHVSRVVGRIHWNDTSWIKLKTDQALVTLQTCIDNDPKGDRYIVQAA
jgi:LPXTG-site transpeptidase (sortase) family protein